MRSRSHLGETEQHVANVEKAFELVGETAKAEKCPGIEGIKKEHDEFLTKEQPSTKVLDMFLTGAAARTEHYEIAAYTGLITMAEACLARGMPPSCSARTSSRRRRHSRRCRRSASDWPRTAPGSLVERRDGQARGVSGPGRPSPFTARMPRFVARRLLVGCPVHPFEHGG